MAPPGLNEVFPVHDETLPVCTLAAHLSFFRSGSPVVGVLEWLRGPVGIGIAHGLWDGSFCASPTEDSEIRKTYVLINAVLCYDEGRRRRRRGERHMSRRGGTWAG